MTSSTSNLPTSTSSFRSNGGYRKRKLAESDLEEKSEHKIFLTEEKLIRNMQTLSLDLSVNTPILTSQKSQDDQEDNPPEFQLHQLLKDNLRKDDLQDHLINQLCDRERKKLSMQIVPYMPVHPAQLNTHHNDKEEHEEEEEKSSPTPPIPIQKENDDHLFKKPFLPTLYFVEEPPDNITKRTSRMKRSYSQSLRSNSNLTFVEVQNDTSPSPSSTDYLIFEPTTPSIPDSSTTNINSSFSTNRPSIQITEYFDFPSSEPPDDLDMQPMIVSDTFDNMTEEI